MTKQSHKTLVSRRQLLKTSALGGVAIVGAPWIVRDAFSSSGELNYMAWAGYDFAAVFEAFTKKDRHQDECHRAAGAGCHDGPGAVGARAGAL